MPRQRPTGNLSPSLKPKRKQARTAGQRAGVSRNDVLGAAGAIVERQGLEQVTMRRLAADLGVAPNALYTYFDNKTALLDALVDAALATVVVPDVERGSWKGGLGALMRASRRTLLAHPHLVPLVIARPGGPSAMRLGESTLRLLACGGVTGARAAESLRALLAFTFGFVALEVPRAADPEGPKRLELAARTMSALPLDQFPTTRATAAYLARHPGDADFEAGLGWLIEGIGRRAASTR